MLFGPWLYASPLDKTNQKQKQIESYDSKTQAIRSRDIVQKLNLGKFSYKGHVSPVVDVEELSHIEEQEEAIMSCNLPSLKLHQNTKN